MFQPTEFLDGENIVIIDDVPHYRYTGVTSYKNKVKHGLSLDYVFYMQEDYMNDTDIEKKENSDNIEEYYNNDKCKKDIYIDYEENHDFYEQKELQTIKVGRKGKREPFKQKQSINMKKNCVRQCGYTDKLFNINQHLSNVVDLPPPLIINEKSTKYYLSYCYHCDKINYNKRYSYITPCVYCNRNYVDCSDYYDFDPDSDSDYVSDSDYPDNNDEIDDYLEIYDQHLCVY